MNDALSHRLMLQINCAVLFERERERTYDKRVRDVLKGGLLHF